MSRIGNAIIVLPKEATITLGSGQAVVKGPKGERTVHIPADIAVVEKDGVLTVTRSGEEKRIRALHGYVRAELNNAIIGATKGWQRVLELSGVGYRAAVTGVNLTLNLGFSHPIVVTPPEGIQFSAAEGKITISGVDKQAVGQIAAKIRELKKPEPYKGKGIKYQGEHIRKKAGKAAKAVGGAPGAK